MPILINFRPSANFVAHDGIILKIFKVNFERHVSRACIGYLQSKILLIMQHSVLLSSLENFEVLLNYPKYETRKSTSSPHSPQMLFDALTLRMQKP
jgi:hypothetical protein